MADAGLPDANDPGLMGPAEVSLLIDQYELTMTASYHRRGMNQQAAFELFARRLPPNRDWLLTAGLGPTLRLIEALHFGERELEYLGSLGFDQGFLDYLNGFRFSGAIDAMPEGTVCFANEPILRVTAPRIEAQLLETLLLNQINFQTMVATKAARVVLAAGGGEPGAGDRVMDFSPRRDHGIEAAMKVARSAAIAGCGGTSNVAAAMRYGLRPLGTMAHSYVMSFESEEEAFRAFLEDSPENTTLLVDTYDTPKGVRNAISAAGATGIALNAIRLDSGDLLELSRQARALLDEAGMDDTRIAVSGDLEEGRIAELVEAGAPIDLWGVGTDLGTSRDSPVVNGVYKLVADRPGARGDWRGVSKLSTAKETVPGAKQVFRSYTGEGHGQSGEDRAGDGDGDGDDRDAAGTMTGDVIAAAEETLEGRALLVPAMHGGEIVHEEGLEQIRERARSELAALPEELRRHAPGEAPAPYPVAYSKALRKAGAPK